jgi:voltage-gated potassium channel Kch
MKYDDELYRLFAGPLQIFERGRPKAERKQKRPYELMLFGYHRGGHEFVMTFRDMHKPYVVIDYNPEVIETLERQHINHIYGDATDYELLGEINAASCHLIVSNLQDYSTNVTLLSYLMEANSEVIFICHASDYDNAARLYQLGASYVMLPRLIGTEHMSNFIRKNGNNKLAFDEYRKHHIITLGKAAIQ